MLALEHAIDATLAKIFGADTDEYRRLQPTKDLDLTSYTMSVQMARLSAAGHSAGGLVPAWPA